VRGNSFLRFGSSTPIKDLIDGIFFDRSSDSGGISDINCHVLASCLCFELQVNGITLYALILIHQMTKNCNDILLIFLNFSVVGLTLFNIYELFRKECLTELNYF